MPDNRNSPQDRRLACMLRNVNKAEPPPRRFECSHPASRGAETAHRMRLSRPNQRTADVSEGSYGNTNKNGPGFHIFSVIGCMKSSGILLLTQAVRAVQERPWQRAVSHGLAFCGLTGCRVQAAPCLSGLLVHICSAPVFPLSSKPPQGSSFPVGQGISRKPANCCDQQ